MGNQETLSFRAWIDAQGVETLARKFEVTKATIWNWRKGHCWPLVHQMRRIRKLSGGAVTYEMIIDRTGNR